MAEKGVSIKGQFSYFIICSEPSDGMKIAYSSCCLFSWEIKGMAESIKGFYNRRHPERTDYYRIIEGSCEEFERTYPELFEEKYGYLRKEVIKAIYAFLDCGIPENGMARVRCEECGHDFFVAYSCRCRIICPSCSTKRSILFGETVREMVPGSRFTVHG